MGIITTIKAQKKKNRVNIYIDGQFSLGLSLDLVSDFNLYKGKKISREELKKLQQVENLSKCLDRAYRLLALRPRSEREIKKKLRKSFNTKVIDQALSKLKKYNYIDDKKFAQEWVKSRSKNYGKKRLFFELNQKGVDKEIIESILDQIGQKEEYQKALNLIRSKSKYQNLKRDEAPQKIGPFLARRGFDYETIKKIINEIFV